MKLPRQRKAYFNFGPLNKKLYQYSNFGTILNFYVNIFTTLDALVTVKLVSAKADRLLQMTNWYYQPQ